MQTKGATDLHTAEATAVMPTKQQQESLNDRHTPHVNPHKKSCWQHDLKSSQMA